MSSDQPTDPHASRYHLSYRDIAMHKVMLQDVVRTEAYEQAIAEVVLPEHAVLDFGCGTGILAMFAARAGAGRVIAVDRSPFIKTAQAIAQTNGLDNIAFYHDDEQSLQIDQKVDVLVSEWMGHCLFYEAMLEPLLAVRDRFLADNGRMIPAEVTLHAGLVCDEELLEDLSFLQQKPYGFDFAPVADAPFAQTDLVTLDPDSLLQNTAELGSLNMRTIARANAPRVFTGTLWPERKCDVYALCGWFSTKLSPGVAFGTGPGDLPTHWDQVLFPLPKPFSVDPARELTLSISPLTEQTGKEQFWAWSISDGEQTQHVDERQQAQLTQVEMRRGKL